MGYIDFKEVNRMTTIDRVAAWLGLTGTRMQCPVNKGDRRELVIFPKTQSFCCYGCRKKGAHPSEYSGDLIQLAAHIKQTPQKAQAVEIMKHFHGYEPAKKGLPEGGLDYLETEHQAVQAIGLSPEKAVQLGFGFAPRGTMRGRILFAIRDTNGKLLGYAGIPTGTDVKLPKNLLE